MLAAAKEFNIGKETLIDFLANKGYDMGGFGSPNARLTAQMYTALQSEFQQDKANKKKSDQIALPKGSVLDSMKKKEKEEAEAAAAANAAAAKKKDEQAPQAAEEPKVESKPEPQPVKEQEPAKPEAPAEPAPVPATPVATTPPASTPVAETPTPAAPEVIKPESPRINGPKVIATIDLDALQPKAKKTPPVEQPQPAKPAPQVKAEPVPQPIAEQPTAPATPSTPVVPVAKEEKTEKLAVQEPVQQPQAEKPAAENNIAQIEKAVQPEKVEKPEMAEKTEKPAAPETQEVTPVKEVKPAATIEKQEVKTEEVKPVIATPPVEKPAAQQEPAPTQTTVIVPATQNNDANTSEKSGTDTTPPEETTGPAVIENIQAEKLTGPKVIGKIDLPVQSDRRDNNKGNNFSRDEKRKRKRIIVEKKPEPVQPKEFSGDRRDNRGSDNRNNESRPPQESRPHAPARDNRPGQGGHGGNRGPGGGHHNNNNNNNRGPGNRDHNRQGQGQGGGGNRRFDNNRPGFGNNRGPNNNNPRDQKPEDKEIDKNEIQNKIKETMAKLGGGGRGKSVKAKHRREKRQERDEQMANQKAGDNKLQVTEFVSVSELANLMDVSFAEVISKCMGLGIMVSINQRLDAEVIELVAGEFGYEVDFIGVDDVDDLEEEEEVDAPEDLVPRAPIVTIMGHVDHGKTSLLDYIRNANVVAGEAGGITQHIGAYQVTTAGGKKITFLDTPGHEAFTAMRARGAKAADIAVIVIAADDAIMPQTREAISHSQAAGLPMVFAINKVDKEGANPEKIKEQLAGMNLLVEDWGGKFQSQEISAKNGLNIDILLEKLLLEAELLELKANPNREGSGSIVEASLDKGRGYVASMLVQNGTLRQGDTIVSGSFYGKIKAMFNERGQRLDEAGPSSPVQVLGLNGAPQAGEKFKMFIDESEAKEVANRRAQIVREQGIRTKKHITLDEIGRRLALGNFKQLNLIIKADFDGSVEALSDSLQKLSTEEIVVSVVHKAVGQITESDVLLATASDAIIVGFQVRPSSQAAKLAEKENIEIRNYSIIYDAIDELKSAMEGMLEPKIEKKVVANVEVRETYRFDKVTVAGCFVLDGKISRNTRINVVRDGIVVFTGDLGSLKRYKDDVKEVATNMECGLSIRGYNDLKVGDIVEGFEEVEVKRTL